VFDHVAAHDRVRRHGRSRAVEVGNEPDAPAEPLRRPRVSRIEADRVAPAVRVREQLVQEHALPAADLHHPPRIHATPHDQVLHQLIQVREERR
jgi:hypothetical protein